MVKRNLKDIVIPSIFIIIAIFGGVLGWEYAVQNGVKLPGIGSMGIFGSNGSGISSSTTSVSTTTLNSDGSCPTGFTKVQGSAGAYCQLTSTSTGTIPVGQVSFNMQLVAAYTDGSNETIVNQKALPGLDFITVNGKAVDHVTARGLVAFLSPNPIPGGNAHFLINFTAANEKTGYVRWRYYDMNTGFVNNSTIAVIYLPDFTMTGLEVYADQCGQLTNGTISCTNDPSTPITQRRVDWGIQATVQVTGLTLVPNALFKGSTASAADFYQDGSVGACTNCSGSNTNIIPSDFTSSSNGGGAKIDTSGGTPPGGTNPPAQVSVDTVAGSNPTTSLSQCLNLVKQLPLLSVTCSQPLQKVTSPSGDTTSTGTLVDGVGRLHGSTANTASLLPVSYIPIPLGNSKWVFANFYGLMVFVGGAVLIAILGVYLVFRIIRRK